MFAGRYFSSTVYVIYLNLTLILVIYLMNQITHRKDMRGF